MSPVAIAFDSRKKTLWIIRVPDAEIDTISGYADLQLYCISPSTKAVSDLDLEIAIRFDANARRSMKARAEFGEGALHGECR